MKINYAFIRAVFALIIGLILVCAPDDSAKYIITTIGVLFLAPGAIILIGYFASKHHTTVSPETGEAVVYSKRFPIEAIGSILLGIWFIATPAFFANLLMMVLSIILIIIGIQQFVMLVTIRKFKKATWPYYIVPTLIFGSGIFALLNPNTARNALMMLIGITGLVYAANELFNWFMFYRHRPLIIEQKKEQV